MKKKVCTLLILSMLMLSACKGGEQNPATPTGTEVVDVTQEVTPTGEAPVVTDELQPTVTEAPTTEKAVTLADNFKGFPPYSASYADYVTRKSDLLNYNFYCEDAPTEDEIKMYSEIQFMNADGFTNSDRTEYTKEDFFMVVIDMGSDVYTDTYTYNDLSSILGADIEIGKKYEVEDGITLEVRAIADYNGAKFSEMTSEDVEALVGTDKDTVKAAIKEALENERKAAVFTNAMQTITYVQQIYELNADALPEDVKKAWLDGYANFYSDKAEEFANAKDYYDSIAGEDSDLSNEEVYAKVMEADIISFGGISAFMKDYNVTPLTSDEQVALKKAYCLVYNLEAVDVDAENWVMIENAYAISEFLRSNTTITVREHGKY